MLKSSQSGRKAASGKETDSVADAAGWLPPLPKAGSVTPSLASVKGKKNKSLDLSKSRQRNIR
jgi:hypothetical protein